LDLTKENVAQRVIGSTDIWIIEFYATWCGHCKNFAPEFKKAAENLKGLVHFAAVDCDNNEEICGAFQVEGFPTVLGFDSELVQVPGGEPGQMSKNPIKFQGQRDSNSVIKFALQFLNDKNIQRVSNENIDDFLADSLNKVMLFSDKDKVSNLFKSLSFTFKNRLTFGQAKSTDVELMEKYKISSAPKIIVITSNDVHFYEGGNTKQEISQFLIPFASQRNTPQEPPKAQEEKREPELHYVTDQESFDKSCRDTGLCFIAFLDPESDSHDSHIQVMNNMLKSFPSVRFMWLNGPSNVDFGSPFRLSDGYPQAVILQKKKLKYKNFLGAFDAEQISEFVEMILKGKGRIASLDALPKFQ
jgi:protein disulfide-isomerase A6